MDNTNMNHSPIKVMVVDDHPVVRDGLKLMLSVTPDLLWVGQAENGAEAIEQCTVSQPDVILMDLIMPQVDGPSATQIIRRQFPSVQVVALTSFDDRELVQKALQAGAISYVLKNASMETITDAIRGAYAGRSTIAPTAVQALVSVNSHDTLEEELTLREKEVLQFMADGLKNASIAEKMNVGESTVRFHVTNIFRKLGTTNRTQTVRLAIERGLIG
jgi:two-component system, NarL family, response regulator LiaR